MNPQDTMKNSFEIDRLTLPRLFWEGVKQRGDLTAMREKSYGIWKDISWRTYGRNARNVAMGLFALGLEIGDRVAIVSENNPQWLYSDMGILAAGGVSVGIYPTDSPNQLKYIVGHCGARFYIAEDEEQLDKILEVRDALLFMEKIIVMDMKGLRDFSDPKVMSFEDLLELGKKEDFEKPKNFETLLQKPNPEDLAILVYTSGTTGPPKGAMLSHKNCLAAMQLRELVDPMEPTDEILCFLPLCHVAERAMSVIGPLKTNYVINFAENISTVPQNIREVSPTFFFAVPRIWEKFYSSLMLTFQDSTRLEKMAYTWAMKIGEDISSYRLKLQEPPLTLKILYNLADLTVLKNLKRFLGLDRVRMCLSGAAPISPKLFSFYQALGMEMKEVYGQTECVGGATSHFTGDFKFGTVGKPMPGIEVKLAEDGEILIKGPTVFMGYYNDMEKTRETIKNGWLYTGDVGRFDEDGHLVITDRKKDIIITSGGKNVTPSEIENQLKFSLYINDAIVIGDGRKYLTALIMLDEENIMKYAQDNRIPFTTYASLTKAPEIIKLISREVDDCNRQLAHVETIKKFRLIEIKLTEEDEEVTPTMKLKRKFICERFKDLIDSMY